MNNSNKSHYQRLTEKEKEELLTMIASSSMKNYNATILVAITLVVSFLNLILLLLKG